MEFNQFPITGQTILQTTKTNAAREKDVVMLVQDGSTVHINIEDLFKYPGLKSMIDRMGAGNLQGTITPESIAPEGDFWALATQEGIYANFNGIVVPANSFAVISRIDDVWGVTFTDLDASSVKKKDVINNLISDFIDKPLASIQGKVLNNRIDGLTETIDNIASHVASGVAGEASPSTVPISEGFAIYTAKTSGIYIDFIDDLGVPIEVTTADLNAGLVQLWGNDNVWSKNITHIDSRTDLGVNYAMFGAIGDGITDDSLSIKAAHDFANSAGIPIVNLFGKYHLGSALNIQVKTDVNWGQTEFIIDEAKNEATAYRFNIAPYRSWNNIDLEPTDKASLLSKYKRGQTVLSELAEYPNRYFIMSDENDVMNRAGFGTSKAKTDLFVIEEKGEMIGDVNWEFTDYTILKAIELETHVTVQGGLFTLNGKSNPDIPGYQAGVIRISRSNVYISRQLTRMVGEDVASSPNRGFYYIDQCYNTYIDDARIVPRKVAGVTDGTYGISGENIFYLTLDNLTATGNNEYWGVMAPNTIKNFYVKNSKLNRIDIHFNGWNLYIDKCSIGSQGIRVTGGGDLHITDTVSKSEGQFLRIREDWGGRWDGDIKIHRCKGIVNKIGGDSIVYFSYENYNYNSQTILSRSIEIIDFEQIYLNQTDPNKDNYVVWFSPLGSLSANVNYPTVLFPSRIYCENIRVTGRERGFILLKGRQDFGRYKSPKVGGYSSGVLSPNCEITFKNVHSKAFSFTGSENAIDITTRRSDFVFDANSLYIKINVENCNQLAANLGSLFLELIVKDTEVNFINRILSGPTEYGNGRLLFSNCPIRLMADGNSSTVNSAFNTATKDDTTYLNCRWLAPIRRFSFLPELLAIADFNTAMGITIKPNGTNGYIYGTHINSILTPEFRTAAIAAGGSVSDELITRAFNNNKDWFANTRMYRGSTAIRPVPTSTELLPIDHFYTDNTLGKPIFFIGGAWKDATGTTV